MGSGFISSDVASLDERFDVFANRREDTVEEGVGIHDVIGWCGCSIVSQMVVSRRVHRC